MTSDGNVLNSSWFRLSLDFGCCFYSGNFTNVSDKIKKDRNLTRIKKLVNEKKRYILEFNWLIPCILLFLSFLFLCSHTVFVFFPGLYSMAVVSTVPSKQCRLIVNVSHFYKAHLKINPNQPLTVCNARLLPTLRRHARPLQ